MTLKRWLIFSNITTTCFTLPTRLGGFLGCAAVKNLSALLRRQQLVRPANPLKISIFPQPAMAVLEARHGGHKAPAS